jgi:diacylglycerol kinase (ATP)
MTDSLCLVVNPRAGSGRAARCLPAVLSALAAAGLTAVRVCEATGLDNAAALAAGAAGSGETVVAVGGDGLVGAVAGAAARAGGTLGVIPAGRGNDFARMLGIPRAPAEAAAVLVAGRAEPVDMIGVRAGDGPEAVVAGSVYLGIIAEAGEIATRSRWVRGLLGYQLAGLAALLAWRPATFTVSVPTGPGAGTSVFAGYCVVAANSGYLAAGVNAAPDASLTDGMLDVLTVGHGSRASFLAVMARAARGAHLSLSQVRWQQAVSVTVTADRAVPAAADGESLPFASPLPAGMPLAIRALPGAVQVIRPPVPGC